MNLILARNGFAKCWSLRVPPSRDDGKRVFFIYYSFGRVEPWLKNFEMSWHTHIRQHVRMQEFRTPDTPTGNGEQVEPQSLSSCRFKMLQEFTNWVQLIRNAIPTNLTAFVTFVEIMIFVTEEKSVKLAKRNKIINLVRNK